MPRSVYTDGYAALLSTIGEVRRERGLTQQNVADSLNRPQSYISKLERGERRIDVVELIELSAALGIEPLELTTRIVTAILATAGSDCCRTPGVGVVPGT